MAYISLKKKKRKRRSGDHGGKKKSIKGVNAKDDLAQKLHFADRNLIAFTEYHLIILDANRPNR